MKKLLNEELLRQIRLMNFDRSKTLLEQGYEDKFTITPDTIKNAYNWINQNVKNKNNKSNASKFVSTCNNKCVTTDQTLSRTFDLSDRACMACHKFIDPSGYFYNDKTPSEQELQDFYLVVNSWNNFEVSKDLQHNILMVSSIIVTLISGGATLPLIIASGLDVTDGMLYLQDGDEFSAGLSFFVAALPGGAALLPTLRVGIKELGLAYKESKALTTVGRSSKPLSKEAKVVKEMLENDKLRREAFVKLIRTSVKVTFQKLKGIKLIGFIFWLIEKGFLTTRFLTKAGVILYGFFITYEQIAKLLGLKQVEQKEIEKKVSSDEVKNTYITFNDEMKTKLLSLKNKDTFNGLTTLLQMALFAGGYEPLYMDESPYITWDKTKKTIYFKYSSNIKNVKIFNITGKLLKTYENTNGNDKFEINNIKVDGIFIIHVESFNNKKDTIKFSPNMSTQQTLSFGKTKLPKWGFYDEWTESTVRNFQKKYNLKFDGVAGPEVAEKIKDLVINKTISESNLMLTFKTANVEIENNQKVAVKKFNQEQLKPENIEKEIEKQKEKISKDVIESITIPKNINIDSLVRSNEEIQDFK
jgi:hypothetical protein